MLTALNDLTHGEAIPTGNKCVDIEYVINLLKPPHSRWCGAVIGSKGNRCQSETVFNFNNKIIKFSE